MKGKLIQVVYCISKMMYENLSGLHSKVHSFWFDHFNFSVRLWAHLCELHVATFYRHAGVCACGFLSVRHASLCCCGVVAHFKQSGWMERLSGVAN